MDTTTTPIPPPAGGDDAAATEGQPAVTPLDTSGATMAAAALPLPTPSVPAAPRSPASSAPGFAPLLCVVDFHHARGPEVEMWFGVSPGADDPAVQYDWPLLPFMALSDGAHASTEDFSYFTLLKPVETSAGPPGMTPSPSSASTSSSTPFATSLFGISCTRQIDAAQLRNRPSDVTRSTVQKAVVVIADSPQYFGMLRERLSVVTKAWFDQREFTNVDILRRFQESLAEDKARGALGGGGRFPATDDEDRDQYLGMSLRELVHEFRWQTLVLLKCCLLQPKMLFFGSRCERLCMMQFSLVSLIPGLLRNLQDCAGPELDSYSQKLKKPTSLRTSDRNSLLTYMGLPLQIFGKGSLFGPYTPLQQLDILADFGTKSYIVGSTNSLLLQQRDRYSDILINLDEKTVNISSTSLRAALQLSVPDRRWIDFITQEVNDTWDESNPGRPKTMGYVGSEEFIRLQFEEYLLSLISSVKYHNYTTTVNSRTGRVPVPPLPHIDGDPSADFGVEFVEAWSRTENYRLWHTNTDSHLFEFVEPKHPCAGGLSIDDVQRRIAQQVQDLHLDERFAQGREVLGRNIAAGREKASTLFNKFYADMEALRESQRRKAEEARQQQQLSEKPHTNGNGTAAHAPSSGGQTNGNGNRGGSHERSGSAFGNVDLSKAQQTVQSVGVRATAYMSSWASWAGEKRKASGWGRLSGTGSVASNGSGSSSGGSTVNGSTAGNGGGGASSSWSLLGGSRRGNRNTMSSTTSDASSERGLRMSISSFMTTGTTDSSGNGNGGSINNEKVLPETPSAPTPTTSTGRSFGESLPTPSSFSSTSQQFPSQMMIRNLDEERPAPLQQELKEKPLPVTVPTTADSIVEAKVGNSPNGDEDDDDEDGGPPPGLLQRRATLVEEQKQQQQEVPTPPAKGSKVMLLP